MVGATNWPAAVSKNLHHFENHVAHILIDGAIRLIQKWCQMVYISYIAIKLNGQLQMIACLFSKT